MESIKDAESSKRKSSGSSTSSSSSRSASLHDVSISSETEVLVAASNIEVLKQAAAIPYKQRVLFTAWHTMCGCVALLAWNMILNSLLAFETVLWPGEMLADILLGCYQSGAVISVLILIYIDNQTLNIQLCRVAQFLIFLGLCLLLIPLFALPGVENISAAKGALAVSVIVVGVGGGIYQAQAFAFASLIPRKRDQQIFISTGNGVGGVISWVTFTICYEAIFNKDDLNHQQWLITVMVIVAMIFLAIAYALFEICIRFPIFVEKLAFEEEMRIKEKLEDEGLAVEEGKDTVARTEFWPTVRRCSLLAFRVGFILYITILLFPACGPFSWPISSSLQNANMGVFQIGDLIFRFIPVLGAWTLFSNRLTWIFVLIRAVILIPIFVMPAYLTEATFIASPTWLFFCMLFMVLTNGWSMTCAFVHCMGMARNKKEAETTANIMTLFLVLGAALGGFSSKIPVIGV